MKVKSFRFLQFIPCIRKETHKFRKYLTVHILQWTYHIVVNTSILCNHFMTMTMIILLFSGIAVHRTYDYIQYIHIENDKTMHRLYVGHFKSININVKDKAVSYEFDEFYKCICRFIWSSCVSSPLQWASSAGSYSSEYSLAYFPALRLVVYLAVT